MRVPQIQVVARPSDDAGIPLLTERLPGKSGGAQGAPTTSSALPPLEFDVTLPASVRPLDAGFPLQDRVSGFTPAPPSFPLPSFLQQPLPTAQQNAAQAQLESNKESSPLEARLREAVLKAVSAGLTQNVESLVRQQVSLAIGAALRDVVEPLVAKLTAEARAAVATTVQASVDKAIAAEMARLRSQPS